MCRVHRIGVIGGGLVGLTLAVSLAKKGIEVDLFEKMSVEQFTSPPSSGRLTNIYLSYRGIEALHKLGLNIA